MAKRADGISIRLIYGGKTIPDYIEVGAIETKMTKTKVHELLHKCEDIYTTMEIYGDSADIGVFGVMYKEHTKEYSFDFHSGYGYELSDVDLDTQTMVYDGIPDIVGFLNFISTTLIGEEMFETNVDELEETEKELIEGGHFVEAFDSYYQRLDQDEHCVLAIATYCDSFISWALEKDLFIDGFSIDTIRKASADLIDYFSSEFKDEFILKFFIDNEDEYPLLFKYAKEWNDKAKYN